MERKIKTLGCGLTGGECPNDNCRYIGTGFGCLYSVTIEKTIRVKEKPIEDSDLTPVIGMGGKVIYARKHNGRNEI